MDIARSQWNADAKTGTTEIFANMLIVLPDVIHSTAIAFALILVGVIQVIEETLILLHKYRNVQANCS